MTDLTFPADGVPDTRDSVAEHAAASPVVPATPTTDTAAPVVAGTRVTTTVNVAAPSVVVMQSKNGPGFGVRALWYLFIGWWAAQIALIVGYLAGLTIIGLPVAFWTFNRIGTILTLRPRSQNTVVEQQGSTIVVRNVGADQLPLWARAVYFVLVGWWLALIWMELAWLLSLTIVGIPLGIMMMNRLPMIYTLQKN